MGRCCLGFSAGENLSFKEATELTQVMTKCRICAQVSLAVTVRSQSNKEVSYCLTFVNKHPGNSEAASVKLQFVLRITAKKTSYQNNKVIKIKREAIKCYFEKQR